jgi:hypothetical protein
MIYIKNIFGTTVCSIYNFNYTGIQLKQLIYKNTNISVDKQRLIYNSKIINDNDIIEDIFEPTLFIIVYLTLKL